MLCYEPACMQRKVTVVLAANTHTLRSVEHTRPHYSESTDSNTAQLDFNTAMGKRQPCKRAELQSLMTVDKEPR